MKDYPNIVEVDTSYMEENFDKENSDVLGAVYCDGFTANEEEEGTTLAVVYLTKKKDIVVAYRNDGYRQYYKEMLAEAVSDATNKLLDTFTEF